MKSSRHLRSPRRLRHGLLLLLSSFVIPHSSFAAQSPLYIPFQGQVTNQTGVLTADGQYSVIFNLYDQAVGGQPVWSERHVKIGVTKGMINVFLGSISPLANVDFSQTKYLGITVDVDNLATTADPEMVPRSLIMPAFHAKNAEKMAGNDWSSFMTSNNPATAFIRSNRIDANTINTTQMVNASVTADKLGTSSVETTKLANGAVTNAKLGVGSVATANIQNGAVTAAKLSTDVTTPAGTIVAYIGDTAPTGWYLCDGSDVPRGGMNSNLETVVNIRFGTAATPATHFKLPDLRGYFLRGVDGSAGRDPDKLARTSMASGGATGNAVGSVQLDELKSHTHALTAQITTPNGGVIGYSGPTPANAPPTTNFISAAATGGSETRPKNAYVNYIIKY